MSPRQNKAVEVGLITKFEAYPVHLTTDGGIEKLLGVVDGPG